MANRGTAYDISKKKNRNQYSKSNLQLRIFEEDKIPVVGLSSKRTSEVIQTESKIELEEPLT